MAGFLVVAALLEEESPLKFLDELNFEYEQQLYSGDLNTRLVYYLNAQK